MIRSLSSIIGLLIFPALYFIQQFLVPIWELRFQRWEDKGTQIFQPTILIDGIPTLSNLLLLIPDTIQWTMAMGMFFAVAGKQFITALTVNRPINTVWGITILSVLGSFLFHSRIGPTGIIFLTVCILLGNHLFQLIKRPNTETMAMTGWMLLMSFLISQWTIFFMPM